MRKLDILVPVYNEDESVIKPLLDSIAIQQNVNLAEDVGVIVCCENKPINLPECRYTVRESNGCYLNRHDPFLSCLMMSDAQEVILPGYPIEEWRDVSGYEGLYKVSSYGRIYSIARFRTKGGFLRPSFSGSNYLGVGLCKNGKSKTHQLHRLVADAFLSNEKGYPEVNHKDECKTNNCVWNLEYCTRLYNVCYGTGRERMAKAHNYKESKKKSALHHDYRASGLKRAKRIVQMDLNGAVIKEWESAREIQRQLKYLSSAISNACNGITQTSYGYRWEFAQEAIV